MTSKQKLILKVVLFLTVPVWLPVALALFICAIPLLILWLMVDDIVEGRPGLPPR